VKRDASPEHQSAGAVNANKNDNSFLAQLATLGQTNPNLLSTIASLAQLPGGLSALGGLNALGGLGMQNNLNQNSNSLGPMLALMMNSGLSLPSVASSAVSNLSSANMSSLSGLTPVNPAALPTSSIDSALASYGARLSGVGGGGGGGYASSLSGGGGGGGGGVGGAATGLVSNPNVSIPPYAVHARPNNSNSANPSINVQNNSNFSNDNSYGQLNYGNRENPLNYYANNNANNVNLPTRNFRNPATQQPTARVDLDLNNGKIGLQNF
jgi:hypothetical protein